MAMQKVNDKNIDLLDGMTVVDGGMFDHIEYRGFNIVTGDSDSDVYTGPFGVGDNMVEVETLTAAKLLIDAWCANV